MKGPGFASIIQRGAFNIPGSISYLQASFESVFAERREEKMPRGTEHAPIIFVRDQAQTHWHNHLSILVLCSKC